MAPPAKLPKPSQVYTVLFDHKYTVLLDDGRRVFVKAAYSSNARRLARIRKSLAGEADILRRLRGLAVPQLTRIPQWAKPDPVFGSRAVYLAENMVQGKSLDDWGMSRAQKVAIWCFVAEQLAAFRRCEVIYTDIKAENVIADYSPLRIKVVDFDSVCLRSPGQRHLHGTRSTEGCEAPERARGGRATERTAVYELGILLPNLLTGYLNTLQTPGILEGSYEALSKMGAQRLVPLLKAILSPDPRRRPANYEEVLRWIHRACLPELVMTKWRDLRSPYAMRLASLGFKFDGAFSVSEV